MAFLYKVWKRATAGVTTASSRVQRFLLNRALKGFVLNPLTADDQFELNVSDGMVSVKDLELNPDVSELQLLWLSSDLCALRRLAFQRRALFVSCCISVRVSGFASI